MGANRVSKKYWKKQSGVVSLVDASDSASVGVDDSGQGAKFEVYDDGSDVELLIHEDAGTQEARLHLRRGTRDWEIINNANLSFAVEASEVMELDNSGNLTLKNNTEYRMEDSGGTPRTTATLDGSDVLTFGDSSNLTTVLATDVKASAYLSSNQTGIANTTWTTVELDTENYDPGGNFDSTTDYDYTAPVAGHYLVTGHVNWVGGNVVANKRYQLQIGVSGSGSTAQQSTLSAYSGPMGVGVSKVVSLSASDTVKLLVWHAAGNDTQALTGTTYYTYMTVDLLSVD